MRTLFIDIETFSSAPLADCGVYKYAESDDFEVLLFGYAFDDDPVEVIDLTDPLRCVPPEVRSAIYDLDVKVAHNSPFERVCLSRYFGEQIPPGAFEDTMIMASWCGLPLSLDAVGQALGLSEEQAKMKEGKALVRKFCLPRKPTKSNPKTRLTREDAPEDWKVFIEYNRRDVETERLIYNRLKRWRPDSSEYRIWALDQQINDRGMRVDLQLARNAVELGETYRGRLLQRAQEISGLQNPNSVEQIKAWLREQEGVTVTSLNKKVVADVVAGLSGERCKEFMALRTEFSKSSTKKYGAIIRSACADEHIHGCFQFAGAGRTGRWAGRLVQLQNLPQNHMEDLDSARQLVRAGDAEGLDLIYPDVQGALSELIRTALIPESGQKFVVADFAAIEARVIAWIAGEEWRQKVFAEGGDIYCMSASQMFKVPVVKHGVNGHLRQKGKVAELACVAKDQLVLTDAGLVPIQDVTTDMKLWDGESWVSHEGVIYKGKREVIEYDGLRATQDHLVWVEGKPGPICFGAAAQGGAALVETGDGRTAIRMGGDHRSGKSVERENESLLGADKMRWMRSGAVDGARKSSVWKKPWLSGLLAAEESAAVVVQENVGGEAAVRGSVQHHVPRVWWPWNRVQVFQCERSMPVRDVSGSAGSLLGDRPHRHEWKLRAGKSPLGNALRELRESAKEYLERMGSAILALYKDGRTEEAVARENKRADHRGCSADGAEQRKELARHCGAVEVYDIRNAGPNHRFTVSGKLVHNCGYGGGVAALKAFGADKLGMTDEEMAETVDKWREASPHIVALWRSLEQAAMRCLRRKRSTLSTVGGIRFDWEDPIMWMVLPSGRRIAYWGADFGENRWGNQTLSYMGTDQKTKKWTRLETWGGKLTENLVQATARDCLKESMLRLAEAGYDIRGHVHDEVIITCPMETSVDTVASIMGQPIEWAPGLLLRADGYQTPYYRKD